MQVLKSIVRRLQAQQAPAAVAKTPPAPLPADQLKLVAGGTGAPMLPRVS